MAPRKDRIKPTHYPHIPFHALRSAQLFSSIIVASITSYFLWQLRHDHYRLPWTFILLLAVSLLTLLSLTITIILHCFTGLNPLLNTVLNSSLLLLWAVSFALLTWWSSSTLGHVCNAANWDSSTGVSICREYKALFSFALLGFLATLLAFLLDVHVQRKATSRGKFTALENLDGKRAYHVDEQEIQLEANPNPSARGQRGGERQGYALPEEQFEGYTDREEDMGYHGAAGQMGRRSLEGRI